MTSHPSLRRTTAAAFACLALAIPLAAQPATAQLPTSPRGTTAKPAAKPTIVLVHGAFADASGWNDVIARLQAKGYPTYAPPNPLRGLTSDAEYLRSFLSTISGPIVLVAHSYGGAVITNAATGNANVKALVYVAAYARAEGETVAAANELGGEHTDLLDHIVVRPFPGAAEGDADVYVDPAAFRGIFAQDLPRRQTAVMAATQRPGAFAALVTPSGEPAWESIPSWYLVARQDHLIPPVAERAMAARAGARTQTVDSSHVAMMSHPGLVTGMVLRAVKATD
jgi:pimeloyl-ACP methyl ester carboxylesterase